MLILLFAVDLQWLPSSGLEGPGGVILPALALAAYPAATLTRLLRASMIETLGADYIRTARAKGLSRSRILIGHALRNAALPALAFTGLQVGFLLGGAVIVEGVFAYPGIGGLALDAVAARDIPLVEAFVWVVAVMILVVNTAHRRRWRRCSIRDCARTGSRSGAPRHEQRPRAVSASAAAVGQPVRTMSAADCDSVPTDAWPAAGRWPPASAVDRDRRSWQCWRWWPCSVRALWRVDPEAQDLVNRLAPPWGLRRHQRSSTRDR